MANRVNCGIWKKEPAAMDELEGAKDLIGWKDVEASRIKHREGVSPEQRKRGKIEASLDSLLFHSRY